MEYADQIIPSESGGDPNAQNPNSSAGGLGQITDPTWLDLINKYRPDLAQGKSQSQILAMKFDPQLNREMTENYAQQNAQTLTNAGFSPTPGNVKLAHFVGPGGALSVLRADPNTPVGQVLSPGAMTANPFLNGMTAGQLTQWAANQVAGNTTSQAPTQIAPTQDAPAPSNSANQFAGMLSSPSLGNLAQKFGSGQGLLNSQPAPNPLPDLTLPGPTPAAQALRNQILASILRT